MTKSDLKGRITKAIDEAPESVLLEVLIDNFGGTKGIRDIQQLESALARPFQNGDYTKGRRSA